MAQISLRPRALAGLRSAPQAYQRRIGAAIEVLRQGRFPPHTEKLGGVPDGYRTRIGRWRILFILRNGAIEVADIFPKKGRGGYRRP